MGLWGQSGRRGGRSSSRLLGRLLDARYDTAEAVLAAVAVVLVVWLLWPEDRGPQIDQQAIWQKSVEEAERRRTQLADKRPDDGRNQDPLTTVVDAEERVELRPSSIEPSGEDTRRRLATPSELADRLDGSGRQPGVRSYAPAPERPSDLVAHLQLEKVPETGLSAGETPSDAVEPALVGGTDLAQSDVAAQIDDLKSDTLDAGEASLEVAALSSDALETAPLPKVDLSDLNNLVPAEPIPSEPVVPAPAEEAETTPQNSERLEQAALTPAPDAAIQPFVVEPDPTVPTTDVDERPLDDAPTWLRHAVTTSVDDERPIIAVVIDDLGLNRSNTAELNDLPSPLTLAFLPYAGRIEAQTEAANAAGHELMLHMPMEPFGSDWPGPDALTTKIDQEEFTARLIKNLDRFEGFVGINNHMGSRLTADSSRMEVVMRELRKRDVLFLDSKTSSRSIAGDVAGENGVPNTTRDVFLDHVIDIQSIKRQLALTERVARRSGSAVAIGHPHNATIQALREWLPGLEARGFALAPISAVVARRACSSGVLIAPETCGRYLQARRVPAQTSSIAAQGG